MGIFRRQSVKFIALAGGDVAALILKYKVLAADDDFLTGYAAGDAVGHDVLHFAVHFLVVDALLGSGLHNGVGHRVGIMHNVHHGGGSMGQGAGLVEHNGVGLGQGFQILAALDGDVVAAALTHSRKHRQRHGQLQRAGKVDHQDRDSTGGVAGQCVGNGGAQQAVRHQLVCQGGGTGLAGRLQLFGSLDHLHDLVIAAVAGLLLHGHHQLAFLDHGAGIHNSAGALAHGFSLASQGGLVYTGFTLQHAAIQRDDAARVYNHGVAGAHLADGHQYLALGSLLPDAVDVQ